MLRTPRWARLAVTLLAVVLAATGCSSKQREREQRSTTLTIAIPDDIQTLDTCCANFIRANTALAQLYDSPVIHPKAAAADGGSMTGDPSKLEGVTFESWSASPDGRTYTVKVRKGMKFHDGKEIKAQDLAYMIERQLGTKGGGNWLMTNIAFLTKKPTVIDDYTLRFTTNAPSQLTMQSFYMTSSGAIDPTVVKQHAASSDPWAEKWMAKNEANGSGPYMLKEWTPDQQVVFQAYPDYWRGKAKIDQVIWKIVPSAAERVNLLKSGTVDMAEGLGTEEFQALHGAAGVKIVKAPSLNMAYVGMNNGMAPFDNKAARQAVSYAVNYDEILQAVYHGDARRAYGPIPSGSQFSLGDKIGYSTDAAKAKQLLSSSGAAGKKVTLSIDSSRAEHQQIAVRVQAALKAIGMNVQIEQLTPAVFAERKASKKLQMFVDEMLPWIDDPDYELSLTLQCGVFGNYANYCNKQVDQIIRDGWTEQDAAKRKAMFEQAQRTIVDEAPMVFLAQPDFKLAMRDHVNGYVHYINEIPRYYDMSVSK